MDLRLNIWIEIEGEVALSRWRISLLEAVRDHGSISAAADRKGVHFRVAWRKIKEMEDRLGTRLVIGQPGGSGGGGASLTPEADDLIRRFNAVTEGLDDEVQARFERHFGAGAGTPNGDA